MSLQLVLELCNSLTSGVLATPAPGIASHSDRDTSGMPVIFSASPVTPCYVRDYGSDWRSSQRGKLGPAPDRVHSPASLPQHHTAAGARPELQ